MPPPDRPSRHAYLVLGSLFTVFVFSHIDRQILVILLDPIKRDLDVSDTQMGLLAGPAYAVMHTLAVLPVGRLADRHSRRAIVALGLAAWSVATVAHGLARSFTQIGLARVGVGSGEATTTPCAHSLIADYFPARSRGTAIAVYSMGSAAGGALGFAIGGFLNDLVGWRQTFVIVGAPGLLAALAFYVFVREPRRGQMDAKPDAGPGEPLLTSLRGLWSSAAFRNIALASGLYVFSTVALVVWAPTFVIRVHGIDVKDVGVGFGLASALGSALGILGGGVLSDRLSTRDTRWYAWLPAIGGLAVIPCAGAFLLVPAGPLLFALVAPISLCGILFSSPTHAAVQRLAPIRTRALASAVVHLVISIFGPGLGPVVAAMLSDGLEPAFGTLSLRYALMITLLANLGGVLHSLLAARAIRRELSEDV